MIGQGICREPAHVDAGPNPQPRACSSSPAPRNSAADPQACSRRRWSRETKRAPLPAPSRYLSPATSTVREAPSSFETARGNCASSCTRRSGAQPVDLPLCGHRGSLGYAADWDWVAARRQLRAAASHDRRASARCGSAVDRRESAQISQTVAHQARKSGFIPLVPPWETTNRQTSAHACSEAVVVGRSVAA